jgi:hypothetical protein
MEKPFKLLNQGDPERMQISFEGKADIFLIKTDQGFIVDVYDGIGEHVNTMTIWNEDIEE